MKIIVCAGAQVGRAVIYGDVDESPKVGEPVVIRNARMVLRWDESCGGLFGLATRGPSNDTRIISAVKETSCRCQEYLTVNNEAAQAIDAWSDYQ